MSRGAGTSPYRPDIDGLRAVAILLVLAYHAAPTRVPGGFVGVDVFFVVSGFLITRILVGDREERRLGRFYARRIRRLAPALLVVLAATLLLGRTVLVDEAMGRLARHTAGAALFVANLVFWKESGYFAADAFDRPLLHLWSLGIEEQFYLVWPLSLWWLRRRPRRALVATLALAAASFAACVVVAPTSPDAVFYLPWFRLWELLAGAALALLPASPDRLSRTARELLALAGAVGILGGAFLIERGAPFPSWNALGPVLGTVLLVAAGEETRLSRSVLTRPSAVGLGKISYPLYLWHWPLIVLLGDVRPVAGIPSRIALSLLAVLLSIVTYRWVEQPARILYRRRPRATVATLSGGMLLLTVLCLGPLGHVPAFSIRPNPGIERVEEALHRDTALRRATGAGPCDDLAREVPEAEPFCRRSGSPEAGDERPLLMWGDSTAEAWAPLVHAVAAERGRPAMVLSVEGCPPLFGVRSPRYEEACQPAADAWKRRALEAAGPEAIVVVARWGAYVQRTRGQDPAEHFVTLEPRGPADLESSREAVRRALGPTLDRLTSIAPVVVLASPPELADEVQRAVPRGLDFRPARRDHLEFQRPFAERLEQLVEQRGGVAVLDPADRLCPGELCEGILDDTFVYLDDNHVTAQGALLFREELATALEQALAGGDRMPSP